MRLPNNIKPGNRVNPARWMILMLVLCGSLVWLTSQVSYSQDETPEFRTEVAPREATLTLFQLIKAGGVTMIPLGLFSMAVVALAIRNYMMLQEKKLLRPDLVGPLVRQLSERDVLGARNVCKENPALLTEMLTTGLDRVFADQIEVEIIKEAIEEEASEQVIKYMTPISYLSIIGAVAPMLGLLGTVSGMIKAFQNISVGGMGKAEVLAANIGEALVTTATGLIIAIPAMILYFYFKNRFMRIMAAASKATGVMMDSLKTGAVPLGFLEDLGAGESK